MIKEKNIGSNLKTFLKKEGRCEDAQATVVKRLIAFRLEKYLETTNTFGRDIKGRCFP
jgi:hypothetical protein